jgi:hypothetical protein
MRRPRRAARGRNVLGLALIGATLAALGAFAVAGVMLRPPPTDAETLCRTDAPIAAHTIILIDATDRLEPRHRRKLRAVADQERTRLAQYERLTLMRLNARRPQEPTILFSKCLPRPPDEANPLFENPRLAQERWDAAFATALTAALRSAQQGGAGRASPILAGLRAVAADPDFGAEIHGRRLVLVSDLLEHDPQGFSLYAEDATYSLWRANDPTGPSDFSNIDVRIAPLDRPDHAAHQAAALVFWDAYINEADAKTVNIDPF